MACRPGLVQAAPLGSFSSAIKPQRVHFSNACSPGRFSAYWSHTASRLKKTRLLYFGEPSLPILPSRAQPDETVENGLADREVRHDHQTGFPKRYVVSTDK